MVKVYKIIRVLDKVDHTLLFTRSHYIVSRSMHSKLGGLLER